MKDMRDQEGLRPIERYRCSWLLLTMPSPSGGWNQRGLSVSITCSSSARPISVERWRPHRSLCQRAPYDSGVPQFRSRGGKIVAEPVLGGLHHIYRRTAWRTIFLRPSACRHRTLEGYCLGLSVFPYRCKRRKQASGPVTHANGETREM